MFKTPDMKIVITVKVPQMYQVANYGLCLTHSFKTHVTFGFMFGWNMINNENWKKCMRREPPTYLEPHGLRISNLIKSEMSNWRNPLLLPVILLEDHVYNADRCKGIDLSPRTTHLEQQLHVTKAGRNVNYSKSLDFEVLNHNMINNRFEIITNINTTITDVVTFACNLKWDNRYCQFLRDISKDIQDLSETKQGGGPELDSTVETLATIVASILEHTEALKARLDVQLEVVREFVSLDDKCVLTSCCSCTI
jgi:hypothetical protein